MNTNFSRKEIRLFRLRLSLPMTFTSSIDQSLIPTPPIRRVNINMIPASEVLTITPTPPPGMVAYVDQILNIVPPTLTTDDDFWRALHEL